MSKQHEALLLALDALESDNPDIMLRASIAIREALAEPEPWDGGCGIKHVTDEPAAKVMGWYGGRLVVQPLTGWILGRGAMLYSASPARKPLTDAEIFNTAADYYEGYGFKASEFARAIERAHGIGGEV